MAARERRSWAAFEGARVRNLTTEGLRTDIARKVARAECSKRRALAQYIGTQAARSGQLLISLTADGNGVRVRYSIDDAAIRDDVDRALLSLVMRAGF